MNAALVHLRLIFFGVALGAAAVGFLVWYWSKP